MTAVPATFGKYFLTGQLATGGMAEIYLAKLIGPGGFEKQLVIKQIHPQFSNDPQFLEMFVAEAKTLVSLSHGNIVPIYELGVVEGTYFIAMEYIDGPTQDRFFRALRKHGESLSVELSAYIIAEILKGLDYAHRKDDGVVHRDLSGRNVMLSRDGGVKLVDFGLAIRTEGQELGKGVGGRPAGSFPYMSPEQVRGESLDPRSDLFSAGVLLWEMLTGQSLFARPDADSTLKAVCEAPIRLPSEHNSEVPKVLDNICMKALIRDREQRYSSAALFLRPLTRFLYTSDTVAGAADLSKQINRFCPPSLRAEAANSSNEQYVTLAEESGESTELGRSGSFAEAADRASHLGGTVVMAGREREPRPRAESVTTFATNAAWDATWTHNADRVDEAERVNEDGRAETVGESGSEPEPGATIRSGTVPKVTTPLRVARGRMWAWFSVALVLLIGFSAVRWWRSVQAVGPRVPDSETLGDYSKDIVGPGVITIDAGPTHEPTIDAASSTGKAKAAMDASVVKRDMEIEVVRHRRDAGTRKLGTAVLSIGASPWADVSIDGKSRGRAPGSFVVSTGQHRVVATFKGRRQVWSVTVGDRQKRALFVDFTKPQ